MIDFLVIGASGMVGGSLLVEFSKHGAAAGTYNHQARQTLLKLNICNFDEVVDLISRSKPKVVLLPAALTNVDYCERNPKISYQVNCLGTYNVVRAVKATHSRLVFFSSDYVFDGITGPYKENDLVNPINIYGMHKVFAENVIFSNLSNFLIIRTTQVFGPDERKRNFVLRLIENFANGVQTFVPIDQIGNPTFAPNLARTVYHLVQKNVTGIFNVVGSERISRYEFALRIAKVYGVDPTLIKPVNTDLLNQVAKRPLNAGLGTQKTEHEVGYNLPGFTDGLLKMIKEGV